MFEDIHAVSLLIASGRRDDLRPSFKNPDFAPLLVFTHVVGEPVTRITAHSRRLHIQTCSIANWDQLLGLKLLANGNQRVPKAPIPTDDLTLSKMKNQFAIAAIFIPEINPNLLSRISPMKLQFKAPPLRCRSLNFFFVWFIDHRASSFVCRYYSSAANPPPSIQCLTSNTHEYFHPIVVKSLLAFEPFGSTLRFHFLKPVSSQ